MVHCGKRYVALTFKKCASLEWAQVWKADICVMMADKHIYNAGRILPLVARDTEL
jgi:hypothetical protein